MKELNPWSLVLMLPGAAGRGDGLIVMREKRWSCHKRLVKLCEQGFGGIHNSKGSRFAGCGRIWWRSSKGFTLRYLGVGF